MAKAPRRETEDTAAIVSRGTTGIEIAPSALAADVACRNCNFWRPEANGIFGGCGKCGTTTTHYGETRYVHYTPDGASCSAFEPKE